MFLWVVVVVSFAGSGYPSRVLTNYCMTDIIVHTHVSLCLLRARFFFFFFVRILEYIFVATTSYTYYTWISVNQVLRRSESADAF